MRHDFIDRYSRIPSPVHKTPAGAKLAIAVALVIATVSVPFSVAPFFVGVALFLLVVAALSRIPAGFLFRRMLLLEPVVLGVALLGLFQPDGPMVVLRILVRSTLCLFTILLLSNTTPFARLLDVLRGLRTPRILVTVLALLYRYLFVLVDETERMKRARLSRTFAIRRQHSWRGRATILGQLFVRTTERAERIYAAMCARGWK